MIGDEELRKEIRDIMKTINNENADAAKSFVNSMCDSFERQRRVAEEEGEEFIPAEIMQEAQRILKEELQARIEQLSK